MTENHNYNEPAQDTQDWHIPNNANFQDLDTDVEIRDTAGNRSNYTPKDGAKYLATDTEEVFLGDGSSWNSIGVIGGGGGSSAPDPADGLAGIQSAIDDAAASSNDEELVELRSEEYVIDGAIDIKRDVTLDCNYATIVQNTDTNVFQCWQNSNVKNFNVDVSNATDSSGNSSWTSGVVVLNTAFDNDRYGAQNERVVVDGGGGHVQGIPSGGDAGYAIRLRADQYEEWITFAQVKNFSVRDFDTVIEIVNQDTAGTGTFINSNIFDLTAIEFREGIYQHNAESVAGDPQLNNLFLGNWQSTGPTQRLWHTDIANCNGNIFRGWAWDFDSGMVWFERGQNNRLINYARNASIDATGGDGNKAFEYLDDFGKQYSDVRIADTDTTADAGEVILADTSSDDFLNVTLPGGQESTDTSVTVAKIAGPGRVDIQAPSNSLIDGKDEVRMNKVGEARIAVSPSKNADYYSVGDGLRSGPLDERVDEHAWNESGSVDAGNAAVVFTTEIASGSDLNIYQAGLLLATGEPAPTGLDLAIATFDNAGGSTTQTTIISGDGTVQNDLTGTESSPVASYSNGTTAAQTVGVIIDNATGSPQTAVTEGVGEVL